MQQVRKRVARWGMVLGVLLGVIWLATGCVGVNDEPVASANVVAALSGEPPAGFARAMEPRTFDFPRDHGAHPEYQTEWWYFTGNLVDAAGNEFGYQFTIFRTALAPEMPARESELATNQVYMAHFAVTDVRNERHQDFERFSRGAGGLAGAQGEPSFAAWLEDWRVEEIEPDVMVIEAEATNEDGEPVAVALTLRETRPPVLNGVDGLSQKGPEPGDASYYYSLVGMETSGTITTGGRTVEVTGLSWMDHEFGTSALAADAVGWDWFSVQLDNGMVLLLARLRTASGGATGEFESTLVEADGTQHRIAKDDFALEELETWTSPTTNITYPSGWRVMISSFDLGLTITPLIRDQEMNVTYVYWEGAVAVEGTVQGAPVAGRGYVELTGYGASDGGFVR